MIHHKCIYEVVYKDFRVSQSQIKQFWTPDVTETFDIEQIL